jgi:hypothetical protein
MQIRSIGDIGVQEHDDFVGRAPMGTLLHTRRFLSYHGDRFRDLSLALVDESERLLAIFPAAADPGDERCVVSHPGATYGGIVHDGRLRGGRMIEALETISGHYAGEGFDRLRYKAIPHIYHRVPAGDDLYALFRLGARLYRCDLSCSIPLGERRTPSDRRRRSLKKALKAGVEVSRGAGFISPLWRVLEDNLAREHGARPVHSEEEIRRLHAFFPDEIEFVVALVDGEVAAGAVLFVTPTVMHAQYIASTALGYQMSALDPVFESCIEDAGARGLRYFDFGTSNEREGRHLNEGLFQFKSEFGGGGVPHEYYELDLRR